MNETLLVTSGSGIVVALITATPSILKEWRESRESEEDRKLALETIEAKNKEIETLKTAHAVVDDQNRRTISDQEIEIAALRKRVALLEEDNRWLQTRGPRDRRDKDPT